MTTKETAKLAVAANDIKSIKDDISEIKAILSSQDEHYITRLEGKAAAWVIAITFALLGLWMQLKSK